MTRDSRFTSHEPQPTGFTLVELSIVLVIIGLIVGAVVGGRSLIKAAELRKVISEVNGYKSAVNAFQLQYDWLPGDMPDASEYWTSCTDSGANTCNGDGDGWINGAIDENYRAWQHLALAKMVPGRYTGVYNGSIKFSIGVNAPESALDGAGYNWETDSTYQRPPFNGLSISTLNTGAGVNSTSGPALSSIDARAIDLKIDDGLADSGKVLTIKGWNGWSEVSGCVTSAYTASSSTYVLSDNIRCVVLFVLTGSFR